MSALSRSITVDLPTLTLLVSILVGCTSLAAGLSAWLILPDKVNQLDARVTILENDTQKRAVAIARIDENVKRLLEAEAKK